VGGGYAGEGRESQVTIVITAAGRGKVCIRRRGPKSNLVEERFIADTTTREIHTSNQLSRSLPLPRSGYRPIPEREAKFCLYFKMGRRERK
jgi:hypothetical protein